MEKRTNPFTLLLASIVLSVATLGIIEIARYKQLLPLFVRAQRLMAALTIVAVGAMGSITWIYVGFDLVPKEWTTEMREAQEVSGFILGDKQGNDLRISRERQRNALHLSTNTVEVGRSNGQTPPPMQLAVVQQGRLMGTVDLTGQFEDASFVVFGPARIYLYGWRNIHGVYWDRN
jgi:hypothetical protein